MAWADFGDDSEQQVFDHYDSHGNPVDRYGNVIPGLAVEQPDFGQGNGPGYIEQPSNYEGADVVPPDETNPPDDTQQYVSTGEGGGGGGPAGSGGGSGSGSSAGGGGSTTPSTGENPFAPWSGHYTPPTAQSLPDAPSFTPPTYTPPPAFSYDASTPGYVAPPVYTPPPAFEYGEFNAPDFQAPEAFKYGDFSYGDFQGPSIDEAINSPGYQFRLQQGTDRLQNAASARGTLNDSGTLKALMDYGQEAGSQEYADVWRRAYDTYGTNRAQAVDQYNINRANAADVYNTNYRTQYADPYAAHYQAALDEYGQNRANAVGNYNTNYQTQFVDPYNVAKDQWSTGRQNALDQYKVNYQTQYTDPYSFSYKAAQDQFAPSLLNWQTQAQNTQHLNDQSNSNAWNDYLLGYQDYEARRQQGVNFALGS